VSYAPTQYAANTPKKPLAEAGGAVRKPAAASAPLMKLQAGESVSHDAFGKGMVLSVRPMGNDALIEVAFDKVGTKKLMLKAAGSHLKKL
jgi:DNA helicase-2/ATP-dependent DNA helicase PcrA